MVAVKEKSAPVSKAIDVNQIYFAGELRQQTRQNILLVAPDQPVSPLRFTTGSKEIKRPLPLLRAFIHRLDRLKRQRNPHRRDFFVVLVLSFPNEFSHIFAFASRQ